MKKVIFDMDGTLIDSEPLHFEAAREVIASQGKIFTFEMHEKYMGTTEEHFWKSIVKELKIDAPYKSLMGKKEGIFKERIKEEGTAFEGVIPLVLKLYKETSLAIASSSPRHVVKLILQKLKIREYFSVIVSGDDIKRTKPDPEIYLKAASLLNTNPKNCLVVEDSINGVRAAKAAGMACVAVTNSFKKEKLKEADYLLSSLKDFNIKWIR